MDVGLSVAALIAILGARFVFSNKLQPYPSTSYDPVASVVVSKKVDPPRPPYTYNITNTWIPSPDPNAARVVNVDFLKNNEEYQNKYRQLVNLTVNGTEHPLLDPADVFKRQTPKGSNLINVLN